MTKTQDEEWRELAAASQKGDKKAYNNLLKQIVPYIRNTLYGSLANPDWSDDITQEVLISIHKSLRTYSADRPFKPWLMAIVSFRKTDFLRKHYSSRGDKKVSTDDYEFQATHMEDNEFAGEMKDIENALDDIPEKQRKVFQMIKIEGFSAQEVANEMGMSESAVKVSAHRTMNKLKDRLQG